MCFYGIIKYNENKTKHNGGKKLCVKILKIQYCVLCVIVILNTTQVNFSL